MGLIRRVNHRPNKLRWEHCIDDCQAGAQSPPASSPGNRVFELGLKNGRLVSGPAVLQVKAGDRITLKIASNNSDELHVHGYDLRLRIKPEEVVNLDFTANRTGRFGLELHRAHAELGALEVYPQ